jgi:hypothetical protein
MSAVVASGAVTVTETGRASQFPVSGSKIWPKRPAGSNGVAWLEDVATAISMPSITSFFRLSSPLRSSMRQGRPSG